MCLNAATIEEERAEQKRLKEYHHAATMRTWVALVDALRGAGMDEEGPRSEEFKKIIGAAVEYKDSCILQDRDGIDPIAD